MPTPWVARLTAKFFVMAASPTSAQQVVEIDFTAGRTIIDDEWNRDMGSDRMVADWSRGILYVVDSEEPNGIMAFSLDTGEWIRTVRTPYGEGPFEFPYGVFGMALTPHGGIYVHGYLSIVEFDLDGQPIDSWRPLAPPTTAACNLNGAPAIPTQGGVVRRGPANTDEHIGSVQAEGQFVTSGSFQDRVAITSRVRNAEIVCTDDRAYVVMSYSVGQDSVFVYHLDGREETIVLPSEGLEGMMDCRKWQGLPDNPLCPVGLHNLDPSFDDRGNLVLLGYDLQVHGVIINPETGCHALLRNATKLHYVPVRIRADSALVFHTHVEQVVHDDGRTVNAYRDTSGGLSMRPLRRVSGEPCPGMLSSVR